MESSYSIDKSNPALYQDITSMLGRRGVGSEEVRALGQSLSENYKTYDDKYVSALLFPEDSEAARIPTKFPLATANAT